MITSDFNYIKEAVTDDLAELLAQDFEMSITEALDALYGSETDTKLCDPATGLYFQSTQYIYSFLKNELATGQLN
jgi:hypothetical protein